MAQDPGDIIRVSCRQRYAGIDDQVNVLHFQITTVPTPNTDAQIMADLGEHISSMFSEISSHISTSVDAVDLTFYNVSNDNPIGVIGWPGPYDGGTASGDSLPSHDTFLLLLPTGLKRTIGRIYLPTMSEASQNGGVPAAGVVTAADTFASYLIGPQVPGGGGTEAFYVVRKRAAGTNHAPTSARLASHMAVQRRRKRGRGS